MCPLKIDFPNIPCYSMMSLMGMQLVVVDASYIEESFANMSKTVGGLTKYIENQE